jgi:hypothetical protein
MLKRPIAVTVVAVLLMLTAAFGLLGDYLNFKSLATDHYETVWIAAIDLLGMAIGAFILRGRNWARWLAMVWMAFHVAISFFDSIEKVLIHSIVLALFAWGLFRGPARIFFGKRSIKASA